MNPETLILWLVLAMDRINPDPKSTVEIVIDRGTAIPRGRGLKMERDDDSYRVCLVPLDEAKEALLDEIRQRVRDGEPGLFRVPTGDRLN